MEPEQGAVLRLHGELDDEVCGAVRRQLAPRLAAGIRHVLLDLTHVTGVLPTAVAMLRALDGHLRRLQGGLLLLHARPAVRRVLRIHDLEHLLEVRDLEPPAIQPRLLDTEGVVPLRRPVRVARK